MALSGPAIVGPLLFFQTEILFSKKILQKLHRYYSHAAKCKELFFRQGYKVAKSAYPGVAKRYEDTGRNIKVGQRSREKHFHVQSVFIILVER